MIYFNALKLKVLQVCHLAAPAVTKENVTGQKKIQHWNQKCVYQTFESFELDHI